MIFEEIRDAFEKTKYKKYIKDDEDEEAFYIKTKEIVIGVFNFSYPNSNWVGKIIADSIENINKTSDAIYWATFPRNKDDFNLLLEDLDYIPTKSNIKSGNRLGRLERTF